MSTHYVKFYWMDQDSFIEHGPLEAYNFELRHLPRANEEVKILLGEDADEVLRVVVLRVTHEVRPSNAMPGRVEHGGQVVRVGVVPKRGK